MNFGGIYPECSLRNAHFVVVPVPYDLTSTYQPGSRRGPVAIIEASTNMELYDEELKKEITTQLPTDVDHLFISSATNEGIEDLKAKLWSILYEENKEHIV